MTLSMKRRKMNEETQKSSTEEVKDSTNSKAEETAKTDEKKESKDTKTEEKKYSDKELNDISLKNEKKALAKQLKDLGIDDIEKAKSILAKAKADEEANKSQDEKTKELTQKYDKARLDAMNSKIENALLKKGVSESRVARAIRLIDKNNILGDDGEVDLSKLNSEVDDTIKDFPELIPTKEEEKKGFKVGGDGKEDEKTDELSEMRKIMGLK
jgi:hypothetical protein